MPEWLQYVILIGFLVLWLLFSPCCGILNQSRTCRINSTPPAGGQYQQADSTDRAAARPSGSD